MWIKSFASRKKKALLLWVVALLVGANLVLAQFFSLDPFALDKMLLRLALNRVFDIAYRADLDYVEVVQKSYLRGYVQGGEPAERWKKLAQQDGRLTLIRYNAATSLPQQVPFVYQTPGQPYLVSLREKYRLKELSEGAGDEYGEMLLVFRWLGTRWDHGADAVPGGTRQLNPALVIEGGARGGKYWCEIAAKVTVEVASALGWPARLVTASKDGYNWDHAVAEIWSNRFNKWFAVDTDFNVIYEAEGIPLSAFELCHDGPKLKRQGRLQLRLLAPAKPSLKLVDLVPFYRYVHIDLRSDWFTRKLRPLSPVGGDLSTWWTARPDLGPILTGKKRVDNPQQFDWKLNQVEISPVGFGSGGVAGKRLTLALRTYSPNFAFFELYSNGKSYVSRDGRTSIETVEGVNVVGARTVDHDGRRGAFHQVSFSLKGS